MNKVINKNACESCGDTNTFTLFTHHDNNYYVDSATFTLARCSTCALVRILNPPSPDKIGKYYPSFEYYAYATNKSVLFELKKKYYRALSRLPRKLSGALVFNDLYFFPRSTSDRVLDVGCGDGSGLLVLKSLGFKKLSGTEIAEESCRAIRKQGIHMYCGSDLGRIAIDEKFDAIRLNHSLEHVYNPRETLQTCNNLLRENGMLFVAVPNFGSLASRIFGKYFCGLQLPTHLYHFDKQTLKRIIESNGFSIVKTKTVGLSGLSYSLKTFLRDKKKINISEIAFLPVLVLFIPIELILNIFRQGFMINVAARKL